VAGAPGGARGVEALEAVAAADGPVAEDVEDPVELAAMGAVEGVGVALGAVYSVGKHGGFIGWDGCGFRFLLNKKTRMVDCGFAGGFGKKGVNFVVLLWLIRGGMRGKRGEFLTPFCAVKNGTGFATLFLIGGCCLETCPAGRAHFAWGGHPWLFNLSCKDQVIVVLPLVGNLRSERPALLGGAEDEGDEAEG
jgi:hypothetical protein